MSWGSSTEGGMRGLWIGLVLILVVLAAGLVARVSLSRLMRPEEISSRLEPLLGSAVKVEDVSLRPWRLEARVGGLELEPCTVIDAVIVRFDALAALRGEWGLRKLDLIGPVWTTPTTQSQWRPFVKGILAPVLLTTRSQAVTLQAGALYAARGEEPLASRIEGQLTRREGTGSDGRVDVQLRGLADDAEEFRVEGLCRTSQDADSVVFDELRIWHRGVTLSGSVVGALTARPGIHAEVSSDDVLGGTLRASAHVEKGSGGPSLEGRAVIERMDGPRLFRDLLGLDLFTAGVLSAEVNLREDETLRRKGILWGLLADCDVRLFDAVLDSAGPLAELIPLRAPAGEWFLGNAWTHVVVSRSEVRIADLHMDIGGVRWSGRGRVNSDRSVLGSVSGRVPASAIATEGVALSLLTGMLADGEGRVPLAFEVTGTLETPLVRLDLMATAAEAAAAGRPQAKRLLEGMNAVDRERLRRTVDKVLLGLKSR